MGQRHGSMTPDFGITEGTRSALFADVVSLARSMERKPSCGVDVVWASA